MANSSAPPELEKQNGTQDMLELTNDLERMIEDVENLSVQLTWMTYDVVRLRISPELVESMQKLKDACDRCKVLCTKLRLGTKAVLNIDFLLK
uniref:Synaptonemal complex central element protein 3 n=1 Tax=Sphaeramia orbicularis TaxID=375764 RepID=A0A673BNY6_9TELE